MKYIVFIPDGAADYPLKELGNKTPLEVAHMPNINNLAKNSTMGLAETIPDGFSPGSDVANLSILGYDPSKYYSGRGPIEAAYRGLEITNSDTVFRCNLITVDDNKITDYSASHVDTETASTLINYLQEEIGTDEIIFYSGISYRHLIVFKNKQIANAETVAPHDVIGQPLDDLWPKGEGAELLTDLIKKSMDKLNSHPLNKKRITEGKNPANSIWLWGSGVKKEMPSFYEKYNLTGGVISAVDLIKGLAVSVGLKAVDIETATGYFDTDYEAKARESLAILKESDFVYVHVEAPDEAGHTGNVEEKVKALENFDKRLMANMLNELDLNDTKILLLPDHATPIKLRTHTSDKVPFMVYPGNEKHIYNEKELINSDCRVVKGHDLMQKFIDGSF